MASDIRARERDGGRFVRQADRIGTEEFPAEAGHYRLYVSPASDFGHIKRHYYVTHRHIDPSGVVPTGPEIAWA